MSQATRDLWPDSIHVDAAASPLVILREQAALLGERTKGLVRAEVESTQHSPDKIDEYLGDILPSESQVVYSHTLYLVAPALDNYRYTLLCAEHDVSPYPSRVRFYPNPEAIFVPRALSPDVRATMSVNNEAAFVQWLQCALQREETIHIVYALVSRVQQLGSSSA